MPLEVQTAKPTIGVVGFPFSKGQKRTGTEAAPNALREGGLISRLEAMGEEVFDHGDVEIDDEMDDHKIGNMRNPLTVGDSTKLLSDEVASILNTNNQALVLGGDHSMAIGSIHGHTRVKPDIVVVWIDAHADINTPLTSTSGNMHGMPLSFLVRELEEFMPRTPGFEWCEPCLSAKDIVYIGLRDVDPAEEVIIEKFGIHHFTMQDVELLGIEEVVERALKKVDPTGARPIHASFDVDAMDPQHAPATGTPVRGGLTLKESFHIAEEIYKTGRLSVLGIAEVNPLLANEYKQELTVSNTIDVATRFFGYTETESPGSESSEEENLLKSEAALEAAAASSESSTVSS